jgi:hypothetical protein
MPPQPLRSVRRNATAVGDPAALRRYPALAADLGEIIALWSRIESTLGIALAMMLKAGVRVSVAMYGAILSSQAQMDALEAAARVTLGPEDFRLFGAVLTLVKRAGSKRHKLAHWLWGYSPEITDALLLIDPDAVLEFSAGHSEFLKAIEEGDFAAQRLRLDLSRVFVYRKRDFDEILDEMHNVDKTTRTFAVLANDPSAAAQQRTQLLAEPQIQEALRRSRG